MDYISHHGILGMKWGVRRYQNKDGSLTSSGKRRYGRGTSTTKHQKTDDENKGMSDATKKRIITGAVASIVTVAAATAYVKTHPEQIGKISSMIKNMSIKDISSKSVEKGKNYVKEYLKNTKNGIKEGLSEASKEAPKKAVKAIVTGVVMNEAKKALDRTAGKEESDKIFKANDPKQIGKFWKVQKDDDN